MINANLYSALGNSTLYLLCLTLGIGFIWFWPTHCVYPVFEGESPPPISTPWESIQWCCLTQHTQLVKPFTIMTSFSLIPDELEAPWLGVNLMVHRWSLMCTNQIDMTAHTPAFFTELGTTHIYVEGSTAGPSHVSHYGAMPVGQSPIHVLTRLMIV